MKIILFFVVITIFFSCSSDSDNNGCSSSCENWEYCNDNGVCTPTEGRCNHINQCEENETCNINTHTCQIIIPSCINGCQNWEKCENGVCIPLENRCNMDDDCDQNQVCTESTHQCFIGIRCEQQTDCEGELYCDSLDKVCKSLPQNCDDIDCGEGECIDNENIISCSCPQYTYLSEDNIHCISYSCEDDHLVNHTFYNSYQLNFDQNGTVEIEAKICSNVDDFYSFQGDIDVSIIFDINMEMEQNYKLLIKTIDGEQIFESNSSKFIWIPPYSGNFYIVVEGIGKVEGGYILKLSKSCNSDSDCGEEGSCGEEFTCLKNCVDNEDCFNNMVCDSGICQKEICESDLYEPNNDFNSLEEIFLPFYKTLTLCEDDIDIFKLNISENTPINISIYSTNTDISLKLYKGDQENLISEIESYENRIDFSYLIEDSDYYYIKVEKIGGFLGDYSLSINNGCLLSKECPEFNYCNDQNVCVETISCENNSDCEEIESNDQDEIFYCDINMLQCVLAHTDLICGDDIYEYNNNISISTSLSYLDQPISANICELDEDWYKISLDTYRSIKLQFSNSDLDILVFDQNMEFYRSSELYNDPEIGGEELITISDLGTFYIKVIAIEVPDGEQIYQLNFE